jgi:hypothetical protein
VKTIILDTNIIIDDPTVLARSSPDLQLIVPSAVLQQLERNRGNNVNPRMTELLIRANDAGTIKVVPVPLELEVHPGLDRTDVEILAVAREYAAAGGDTILATRDLGLHKAAAKYDLQAVDLVALRDLLSTFQKTNQAVLTEATKVVRWRYFHVITGAVLGVLAAVLVPALFTNIHSVLAAITVPGTVLLIAASGIVLFGLRAWYKWHYGMVEFFFGLLAVWYSLSHDFDAEGAHTIGLIKVAGSLYIMVRGLDNVQKSYKGTDRGKQIDTYFPP